METIEKISTFIIWGIASFFLVSIASMIVIGAYLKTKEVIDDLWYCKNKLKNKFWKSRNFIYNLIILLLFSLHVGNVYWLTNKLIVENAYMYTWILIFIPSSVLVALMIKHVIRGKNENG